jgi:hypothetical protein
MAAVLMPGKGNAIAGQFEMNLVDELNQFHGRQKSSSQADQTRIITKF